MPERQYTAAKAIAALIIGALFDAAVAVQSYYSDGKITTAEWLSVGTVALGTLATSVGVFQVKNRPKFGGLQ